MKRIVLTLIFVIAGVITSYSQNVLEYFYPMNSTTELTGPLERRTIETVLRDEFIQCRIHVYSRDIRSYQPKYRYEASQDFIYTVENNKIVYNDIVEDWLGGVKYQGSYTRLCVPLKNEEVNWKGRGDFEYTAKQIKIKTKKGNLDAIGVVCYASGYIQSIECWCKNWGLSLSVNKEGELISMNSNLFDADLVNSLKSTQWNWVKHSEKQIAWEQSKINERLDRINKFIEICQNNPNITLSDLENRHGYYSRKGNIYLNNIAEPEYIIGKYTDSSISFTGSQEELKRAIVVHNGIPSFSFRFKGTDITSDNADAISKLFEVRSNKVTIYLEDGNKTFDLANEYSPRIEEKGYGGNSWGEIKMIVKVKNGNPTYKISFDDRRGVFANSKGYANQYPTEINEILMEDFEEKGKYFFRISK